MSVATLAVVILLVVFRGQVFDHEDASIDRGEASQPIRVQEALVTRSYQFGDATVSWKVPQDWDIEYNNNREYSQSQFKGEDRSRRRWTLVTGQASMWVEIVDVYLVGALDPAGDQESGLIAQTRRDYQRLKYSLVTEKLRTCRVWSFLLRRKPSGMLDRKTIYYFEVGRSMVAVGFVAPEAEYPVYERGVFSSVFQSVSITS